MGLAGPSSLPAGLGVRLSAVLPAEPEAVPAADVTVCERPRPASPPAPTFAPTFRDTASSATANWWTARGRDRLLAARPGRSIGCSFTFENALLAAGGCRCHIELNRNVPMFRTNCPYRPAGHFHSPLVVSMRPMSASRRSGDRRCARFPRARHAGPRRHPVGPGHRRRPPPRLRRPRRDPPARSRSSGLRRTRKPW